MATSNLLEKKSEFAKFLVYLGAIALQKICFAMTAPILAQWDWATVYEPRNGVNATLSNEPFGRFSNSTRDSMSEQDISWNVLGVLLISPILSLLFAPVCGVLGDKFGCNIPLLLGLFSSLIMEILLGLLSSFGGVMTAFAFLGLSDALITPNAFAAVNTVYSPETKKGDVAMGIAMTTNVISFLGPAIIGILFEYAGQTICFIAFLLPYTVILFIGIILICLFEIGNDNQKEEQKSDVVSASDGLLHIYTNCELLIAMGALAISFFPRKSIESVISIWMQAEFSSGPSIVGLVLSSGAIGVLIGNIVATFFALQYQSSVGFQSAIAVILAGASTLMFSVTPTPWSVSLVFGVYILFATCARYSAINLMSLVGEKMPDTPRSSVMSMAAIGFHLPNWASPLVAVPLYNTIGFQSMCRVIGPAVLFYGVLMMVYYELPKIPTKYKSRRSAETETNEIDPDDKRKNNNEEKYKLLDP